MHAWYERSLAPDWGDQVRAMLQLLKRGNHVYPMIQVTGDEGITLEDFVVYQQALFLENVFLQQDAFDAIDIAVPLTHQLQGFRKIQALLRNRYRFGDQDAVRRFFTLLTGLFKYLNYAPANFDEYAVLTAKNRGAGGTATRPRSKIFKLFIVV